MPDVGAAVSKFNVAYAPLVYELLEESFDILAVFAITKDLPPQSIACGYTLATLIHLFDDSGDTLRQGSMTKFGMDLLPLLAEVINKN